MSWWIAHSYPLPCTPMLGWIRTLAANHPKLCRSSVLCETMFSECPMLSITDWSSPEKVIDARPVIVISARVHPGETPGSWMVLGLLTALLGGSADAVKLRENVVIRVIPLLNPEGVMLGNYRCSPQGFDLNRCWRKPDPSTHPTISAMKQLVKTEKLTREVLMYCDFHSHSRKNDVFIYGCVPDNRPALRGCWGATSTKPSLSQSSHVN